MEVVDTPYPDCLADHAPTPPPSQEGMPTCLPESHIGTNNTEEPMPRRLSHGAIRIKKKQIGFGTGSRERGAAGAA